MKASPAGHTPVCPTISLFAAPGLPRTDTLNPCNAISGPNEKNLHLDSTSYDFPALDNTASVAVAGRFRKPRITHTWHTRQKDCRQVDKRVGLVYPGMV